MAVDLFLKIDGIEGESMDSKHAKEIEVESFSWGETQSGTSSHGAGLGAGKVNMQDFHFVMRVNKASPKLMLACASGEHIKSAILTCRKAGKEQQEFLKIAFSDVLVSSYQTGAASGVDSIPLDQISLNYSKIEYEYKEQKADGTLAGAIKTGWDLKLNKKV
ncbi:MAG: type VI secretion system tube protein Hcp [Bryobacteraceae bacterium]|nr:type VI secretion system tube protein Hcp [Bryobacterales bacterium]NUN03455.1 type VI secretion system tube protein Hcp [Bryobacteraceae bacterium]